MTTIILSDDTIKDAIAAGRNLYEYTYDKKNSKVMCEKSIKNKNGVCNTTNKKLRKKFSQKVQETLDCFENKILLITKKKQLKII